MPVPGEHDTGARDVVFDRIHRSISAVSASIAVSPTSMTDGLEKSGAVRTASSSRADDPPTRAEVRQLEHRDVGASALDRPGNTGPDPARAPARTDEQEREHEETVEDRLGRAPATGRVRVRDADLTSVRVEQALELGGRTRSREGEHHEDARPMRR